METCRPLAGDRSDHHDRVFCDVVFSREIEMRREIKFRAWDSERKVIRKLEEVSFHEDGTISGCMDESDIQPGHITGRVFLGESTEVSNGQGGSYVDDYPLMQFTGLHDCNDIEIYEGDIVSLVEHPDQLRVIRFKAGTFWFAHPLSETIGRPMHEVWDGDSSVLDRIVIGNIYENPELLKKENLDFKEPAAA